MTAAWAGICCSKPPCVTISLRKATYTYGNIMERQAYTLSVPSDKYVQEADYFGIASGREVNKFTETNLTPVKSELVDAPYVGEFPMVLECKLIHHHEIGLHTHFIGEIFHLAQQFEGIGFARAIALLLQYLVGITPEGSIYKFAHNAASDSEFAGATFSPDGSTLFVNIQGDGLTLAITGPWQG